MNTALNTKAKADSAFFWDCVRRKANGEHIASVGKAQRLPDATALFGDRAAATAGGDGGDGGEGGGAREVEAEVTRGGAVGQQAGAYTRSLFSST
jgi:hypothetical protein